MSAIHWLGLWLWWHVKINKKSSFEVGASLAGFRHCGGKFDDITVVIAYIYGPEHKVVFKKKKNVKKGM